MARSSALLRGKALVAGYALLLLLSGCTLALRRDHDQCATSQDCQALAAGAVCTDHGVCERLDATRVCQRDADCEPSSLCRAAVCQSLVLKDCVAIGRSVSASDEERLPLAVLVPRTELGGTNASGMLGAALTAIDEINDVETHGHDIPRVVAVGCPDDDTDTIANLAKLGVEIFVGPKQSNRVRDLNTQALNAQAPDDKILRSAVFFAPFANAPSFETGLSPNVVSCTPNVGDNYAAVVSAVKTLHRLLVGNRLVSAASKAAMAFGTKEVNLGFTNTINAIVLGTSIGGVNYDDTVDGGLQNALVTQAVTEKVTPRLIAAASGEEDWTSNINAVDNAANAGSTPLPYYLLSGKQPDVLALASDDGGPTPRLYTRVLGLDRHLDEANAQVAAAFELGFAAETDDAVSVGLSAVYDCTYLAVYAALAAQRRFALLTEELSPEAVVVGLRAVTDASASPMPIGKIGIGATIERLNATGGADASLRLIGASGDLTFVLPTADSIIRGKTKNYESPQASAQEMYCVDATAKAFCNMGLRFSPDGTEIPLTNRECTCLPQKQ